jgi:hypothetical protein
VTVTASPGAPPSATPSVSVTSELTRLTTLQGTSIIDTFVLTSVNGYAGTLTLSCPTLPANASCSFEPGSTVNIEANGVVNVLLRITTQTASTAALRPIAPQPAGSNPMPMLAGAFWLPGLLAAGAGLRKRKLDARTRQLLVLLVLLAGVGMMTACGGSGTATGAAQPSGPMTAKGTYTVPLVISGTNGLAAQTLNLTLTVQ